MRKIWAFLWKQNLQKFETKVEKIGLGSFKYSNSRGVGQDPSYCRTNSEYQPVGWYNENALAELAEIFGIGLFYSSI